MSEIEWTERTWNPIAGCTAKSEGCTNCYAINMANRLQAMGLPKYQGLVRKSGKRHVWTGKFNFDEKALLAPLSRKKPTKYFVNSMSDLFHENVPDEWIDKIFAVMALCPQHTFQILTKRPERMREYFKEIKYGDRDNLYGVIYGTADDFLNIPDGFDVCPDLKKPLPNVWLGVSIEDQKTADERIPLLLDTPAAVRWVSAEPLLGPVNLTCLKRSFDGVASSYDALSGKWYPIGDFEPGYGAEYLDWVVVGGESGHGARPMLWPWADGLREQCEYANVPFLFKQWGAYDIEGNKVGKKKAGRLLNGKTYEEYPQQAEAE